MALRGDLASVDLAQVFQMLALNKKTGLLSIQSPRLWEVLYFHPRGVTLYYNPHGLLDRALQTFVRVGRTEQSAIDEVRDHAARHQHELWDALLAGGYLTEEELTAQMRYEVEEEIYELFFCRDGRFEFLEGKDSLPEREGVVDPRFFFNTESVIMEAARRIDEWSYIADRIPSGLEAFRRRTKAAAPEDLGEEGVIVLNCVDSRRTASRIVEASGLSNFVVFKMLTQLLDAGIVEHVPADQLLKIGQSCMRDGRHEDAISLFEKALELEVGVPDVHSLAAAAYKQTGQFERASYHLSCDAEFRIASGDARGGALRLRAATLMLPTDLAARERLVEVALSHAEVRLPDFDAVAEGKELVDLWLAANDLRRVRGLLERLLTVHPEDIELKHQLINVHTKAGDQQRVVQLYESIAKSLVAQDRPIEAIAALQKILMLDRSRRDIAEQVRQLYAKDERSRRRRRALATLGAFCALLVALGIAFSVYDETAAAEFAHIDVETRVAADEFDAAAAVYDEFLVKYPLTSAAKQARAELVRIDGLRQKRSAEFEAQRAARDVERQKLRGDYKTEWARHRELFQQGKPEDALAVVEKVRAMVAAAGGPDDIAWALEEQVDKTCTMLRDFVKKAGDLADKRMRALESDRVQDAWSLSVELHGAYEITEAARRSPIPFMLRSRPLGARVLKDGKPVMVQRDGKSVEAKTPALLMCGKQPEAFTLELEGFSPAQVTVQAMQRASTEAPLPVIPAHRVHFTERVQTEVAAAGGWVIAGLRNGKLGIASARTGQVLRIVDLGGLRAVEGSPFAIGDRAWYFTNEGTLECTLLETGESAPGWPIQASSLPQGRVTLRDGRILYVDRDNVAHCVDQTSGRVFWSRALDAQTTGAPSLERRIARIAHPDGRIVRIDANDGKLLPSHKSPSPLTTGVVAHEDMLWFGCADGKLRAMDDRTGRIVWTFDLGRVASDGEVACTRTAVVAAADGRVVLLDKRTGKQTAQSLLPAPIVSMRMHGGSVLTVARAQTPGNDDARDMLQARDASTLAMQWEYEDTGIFSGAAGVGGMFVAVAGADGDVVLLR
jgi:outer membrane protein assembly factor BamB/tetratricopeptide (TPR) repeat protein